MLWTDGIDGTKVPTSRVFYSMKNFFELIITNTPGHYINATEGGVHLEGTEALSLKEAINLYCSKPNDISNRIGLCSENSGLSDTKKLLSGFRTILKQLRNIQKTIKKADRLTPVVCNELSNLQKTGAKYRSFSTLPKYLQKQVNEIEAYHKKIEPDTWIFSLLQEITG